MHVLEILLENTSDDTDAHEQAAAAYRLLSDYVTAGRGPDFNVDFGGDKGPCYGFDPIKLGITDIDDATTILIAPRNVRSKAMAGAIWKFNSKPLAGRYRQALVVHALHEYSEADMRRRVCSVPFRLTFIHEYVHLRDARRTHNKMIFRHDASDKTKYYNDPAEFNAYFHTFAEPWLDCYAQMRQNPADASDLANIASISGDFQRDLKHLMQQSSQSQTFFAHLSGERRKAIIGRLYRLHHELSNVMNGN